MIAGALGAVCRAISGPAVEWRCDPLAATQRIYFGNHSSHLDFIVIWSVLPPRVRPCVRPVAGQDYWAAGAVRRHLSTRVFRAVLVDRNGGSGVDPLHAAHVTVERIAREMGVHDSLIVFPEGTRSLNGNIGKFKSGLFHLAGLKPDAELIPVYLDNLNRVLPKGESCPVPMLSRVTFGSPLPRSAGEDKAAFLFRSRAALLELRSTP
jgi:1-acyl-sn-glycerol-3-phosphate acyltransferase